MTKHRTITIDLATGEWLASPEGGISNEEGARVAAAVLPGMDAEDVADWYGQWGEANPSPDTCDPIETFGEHAARLRAEREGVEAAPVSANDSTVMHIAGQGGFTLCGKRDVSHRTDGQRYAECPECIAVYNQDEAEGVNP